MSAAKRDGLNLALAKSLAWKSAASAAATDLREERVVPSIRSVTKLDCVESVAAAITEAWETTDTRKQGAALASIWARASENHLLDELEDFPLEQVRLARLIIRHSDRFDPTAIVHALGWIMQFTFSHPEASELVIDMLGSANPTLSAILGLARRPERLPQLSSFGRQLAKQIDASAPSHSRVTAIGFAPLANGDAVVPALVRALREHELSVRAAAIIALRVLDCAAITADDVLWLLNDAVDHQVSPDVEPALAHQYERHLLALTTQLKPNGSDALLLRILDGDCAAGRFRIFLSREWALQVLASAYPELAIAHIDRSLRSIDWAEREAMVQAAACLPIDEAKPRLLFAAQDGCPMVSGAARAAWLRLFGGPCPEDELSGVASLLSGPPSAKLRSRALGLRGPRAAREKLISVLLAEAPDAETLGALVIALASSADIDLERPPTPGLPHDRVDWCRLLIEKFGDLGAHAVLLLDSRYGNGCSSGWLCALVTLVRTVPLQDETLREVAMRASALLLDPNCTEPITALHLARTVGFDAAATDRLWATASQGDDPEEREAAAALLGTLAPLDWLMSVPLPLLRSSMQNGDLRVAARTACVLVWADILEVTAIVLDLLAISEQRDDLHETVIEEITFCARVLRKCGPLPQTWQVDKLRVPEKSVFGIATRLCDSAPEPNEVALLHAALESSARQGAAAVEAAIALRDTHAFEPAQLTRLFASAPLTHRARLLAHFPFAGPSLMNLWPAVESIMLSNDEQVTSILRRGAVGLCDLADEPLFRATLTRMPDKRARITMRSLAVGTPQLDDELLQAIFKI